MRRSRGESSSTLVAVGAPPAWPASSGVGRVGARGAAPAAPGVWGRVGTALPTPGRPGRTGVITPRRVMLPPSGGMVVAGCPERPGEANGAPDGVLILPVGPPRGAGRTCWAMLSATSPRARPTRNIPTTYRHTQQECDTASPSHLHGYLCTVVCMLTTIKTYSCLAPRNHR